jgi:hypothetical protein
MSVHVGAGHGDLRRFDWRRALQVGSVHDIEASTVRLDRGNSFGCDGRLVPYDDIFCAIRLVTPQPARRKLMAMSFTVSDVIVETLKSAGVRRVYGIPATRTMASVTRSIASEPSRGGANEYSTRQGGLRRNDAGIMPLRPPLDAPTEESDRMVALNVQGVL